MIVQIPKVIHYCWFGGNPLPDLANKCIASWRKYLPDYEIKEWNESNFDVYQAPYIAEAYKLKKYAHVSDYARFWILYHFGGIYFDTDVEVIRPLDDIIARGSFLGFECQEGTPLDNPNGNLNPGLGVAVPPNHSFFGIMLDFYNHHHFVRWNGKNSGNITHKVTRFIDYDHKEVLDGGIVKVNGLYIYPIEYFCPLNYYTGQMGITDNTRTIHHYMASWVKKQSRLQGLIERMKYICVRIFCTLKYSV
ncbi:MAG: glycosyl transferase [Prevotella sp.]|nr:glycosyl transferase [Prevotella sp.]